MSDIANYVYFTLIYDYLSEEINTFGMDLMRRMMTWASAIALTLVTLWIIVQGYRVMSGRSREPLMEIVLQMGRIVVIVGAATTMAIASTNLNRFLTVELDKEIHYLFTGKEDQRTSSAIDENLAYTQIALSTINSVKVISDDPEMLNAKERNAFIATIGSASPPMAAAAMLLLYQFAIALFIGLGPLFILCLIFEQTKDLFRRWLMYGVGTIFSMALLSVVASMVLELTLRVSAAMWGAKIVNHLLLGDKTEGLTSTAMQQGGIGLLLSILIVSVPPMAAMFFQGTLGSALTYTVFGGAGGRPGPQGQPPGSWGHNPGTLQQGEPHHSAKATGLTRTSGAPPAPQPDAIKQESTNKR